MMKDLIYQGLSTQAAINLIEQRVKDLERDKADLRSALGNLIHIIAQGRRVTMGDQQAYSAQVSVNAVEEADKIMRRMQ